MDKMDMVKEWHKYAEMDLNSANHLLTLRPTPLEIIAYHCQQSAEKYLKSYLVYMDKDVVKTHDLRLLCEMCSELCGRFDEIIKQCSVLVQYVANTRYPSPFELTNEDIKQALKYAGEIKVFVIDMIS
jgi:HEPN domain-containing protein